MGGRRCPAAPALASITSAIAIHARAEQMLVQEQNARERRDRRLEREHDAEDVRRQPAQRLELERPRQRRRQQADADRCADELRVAQVVPRA